MKDMGRGRKGLRDYFISLYICYADGMRDDFWPTLGNYNEGFPAEVKVTAIIIAG